MNSLTRYKKQFKTLNVKILKGKKFPHKAIVLLGIMDLVRCGYIIENKIYLDETLKYSFDSNWRLYVGGEPPLVWIPFWHMKNEPFWHFKPLYQSNDIEQLVPSGQTASIGKMRSVIEYAYLDGKLYEQLRSAPKRQILYEVLRTTYL